MMQEFVRYYAQITYVRQKVLANETQADGGWSLSIDQSDNP
ncbi:MAG: hypothetical protein JWL69_1093 [Phycisphaerales bacterium]|nr:hypothetical protein [Phycisphaerales bacterium]MDB5357605.1 hypothetical protein [Phycisphaerales bacterium]